ncbi:hypothetical protein [Thiomonas sp. 13-64-67]|uniref:hypothetical protein n=1 Tax=Thiomonas sp. 13-64-67 TaxID=1970447 RepID=UPI0025796180|nr:hypothetical protein [Thiomonas sp. 13-64-67]
MYAAAQIVELGLRGVGLQGCALQPRRHIAHPLRQAVDVVIETGGAAFGERERLGGGAQRVHAVQQHLPHAAELARPIVGVDQVDIAQRGFALAADQIEHGLQHALAVFAYALKQPAGGDLSSGVD